jgi:hypothetical protein
MEKDKISQMFLSHSNSTIIKLFSVLFMIQEFYQKSEPFAMHNIKHLSINKMEKNTLSIWQEHQNLKIFFGQILDKEKLQAI